MGPTDEPQPGAVYLLADPGGDEQQQQTGDAQPVLVPGERPEVAHDRQHEQEGHQADHQPHGLLQGEVLVDAVEQQQAQGREERGHRQQIGIGARDQHPAADVGDGEEHEEESAVRQRRPGEGLRLDRVDQGEPQSGQDQRRKEKEQLAVTDTHCSAASPRKKA